MFINNYNRGKFNVSSANMSTNGVSAIKLSATVKASVTHEPPQSAAPIRIMTGGKPTRQIGTFSPTVTLTLNALARATNKLFSSASAALLTLGLSGASDKKVFAVSSTAILSIGASGKATRKYFSCSNATTFQLLAAGSASRLVFSVQSRVALRINTYGSGIRRFTAQSPAATIVITATGVADILGYAVIELPNLVIPPGGDVVIDTEKMTVTLNGDDVTRYFSPDSEFFKLKPGDNVIIYEDGQQNRNISYKILWKDLWV